MVNLQGDALDLTRCHFERRVQDMDVFGTWFFGEDGPRPCIALLPANRGKGWRSFPVVIPVDDAWIWSPEIGNPRESAQRSMRYARVLRLNTADLAEPFRIAQIIAGLLPDLLTIPPFPASERVVAADAIVLDGDGRTTEREILDYT